MSNQASLLIEVPRIHEIKFRSAPFALGFDELMHVVFPKAHWYPRYQEWTIRVTDEEYADTRAILDQMFESFYADKWPELTVTLDVSKRLEIAPLSQQVPKIAPAPLSKWARYIVPAGESANEIPV
jgi:hypothetical protein